MMGELGDGKLAPLNAQVNQMTSQVPPLREECSRQTPVIRHSLKAYIHWEIPRGQWVDSCMVILASVLASGGLISDYHISTQLTPSSCSLESV